MNAKLTETSWLDAHFEVSFEELARLSGLPQADLRELVEYGALVPSDPRAAQWVFSGDCVVAARTAQRLRESFDLDANALSLALSFLGRIRSLEEELRALRAQLPRGVPRT